MLLLLGGPARTTLLRRHFCAALEGPSALVPEASVAYISASGSAKKGFQGLQNPVPRTRNSALQSLSLCSPSQNPGVWGQQWPGARQVLYLTRNEVPSGKARGLALPPTQRALDQSLGHREPVPSSVTREPIAGVAVTTPPSGLCEGPQA